MPVNPLFNDGYFFFSNMYDDSLLDVFYQKVSSETFSRTLETQKYAVGRGTVSEEASPIFRGDISDFSVDRVYNKRVGLHESSLTLPLEGVVLPIKNKKLFLRTYKASNTSRIMKIPMEDFITKPKIFSKRPIVQFGEYQFMRAVFVIDEDRSLRLALPYSAQSSITDDSTWGSVDYSIFNSYVTAHADDANDTYRTLWIIWDECSTALKYGNGKNTSNLLRSSTASGNNYLVSVPKTGYLNRSGVDFDSTDANSWDYMCYYRNQGNLFYSIPCTLQAETTTALIFAVPKAFIDSVVIKTSGNGGVYGYFIRRPNRRRSFTYSYDVNKPPIIDLGMAENPGAGVAIEVFEYNVSGKNKTARLVDEGLVPKYYPSIYDLSSLNVNNKSLYIEVSEYLSNRVNETMRDSLKPLRDSLGDAYRDVVVNGYDVIDPGDESQLQKFNPRSFAASSEDYMTSEYKGNIRGYILDKLVSIMASDPPLNVEYQRFMNKIDPAVVTISGTPRQLGFNTGLSNEYTGKNPIVYSTTGYTSDPEKVVKFVDGSGGYVAHSFIAIRSNDEMVGAEVFLNGKHIRPSAHTFYGGLNYLFLPVSVVASAVSVHTTEKLLKTAKPILIDFYPHSYLTRSEVISELVNIGTEPFQVFQHDLDHKVFRIRDLVFYRADGDKEFITDWLKHFDVLLEVNKYRIALRDQINYIYLRKDQDLNSIVPKLTGLFPGASVTPIDTVRLSLHETLDQLVEAGLATTEDIRRLINKSLPLSDVYIVPTDGYFINEDLMCTLNSFDYYYTFKGSDLDMRSGSIGILTLQMDLLDPVRDDIDGYHQYVLYRNGILEKNFFIQPINQRLHGSADVYIFADNIQASDSFELVHLPCPVSTVTLGVSPGLKYMEAADPTGTTIGTLWPDDYTPITDGLLLLGSSSDPSSPALEAGAASIFTANGLRLPIPTESTGVENAVFYDASVCNTFADKSATGASAVLKPTDLSIITGTNIPAASPLNFVLNPIRSQVNFVRLFLGEDSARIQSLRYKKDEIIFTGCYTGGELQIGGEDWVEMNMPEDHIWKVFAYADHTLVALGKNSDVAAFGYRGDDWQQVPLPTVAGWCAIAQGNKTFVAVATDSIIAAYSRDAIEWKSTRLPASRRWTSVAYGNGVFVAVASGSNKGAYSSNGITWSECTLTTADWRSVIFTGSGFLAVSADFDTAMYSIDGHYWAQIHLPRNIDWLNISTEELNFMIFTDGVNTPRSHFGAYTTDGVNWSVSGTRTELLEMYTIDDTTSEPSWDPLVYGDDESITLGFLTTYTNADRLITTFVIDDDTAKFDVDNGAVLVDQHRTI